MQRAGSIAAEQFTHRGEGEQPLMIARQDTVHGESAQEAEHLLLIGADSAGDLLGAEGPVL